MSTAITLYACIAAASFVRGAWSWLRAYDRFYSPGAKVIAREWSRLLLRSVSWPVVWVLSGAGWAIDCGRWVWALRPRRKPKDKWREVGRKFISNEDGGEMFVYLEGPKNAIGKDAIDHCPVKLYDAFDDLRAHTIDSSFQSEGYWTVRVQYAKPKKCEHNWLEITSMEDNHRRYLCSDCGERKIGNPILPVNIPTNGRITKVSMNGVNIELPSPIHITAVDQVYISTTNSGNAGEHSLAVTYH